jgi:hypothetical protein
MDVRSALKSQYHASLAMLRQAIENCPDDLWTSGEHPRNFWRIAYHAMFYADLYLGQNEEAFRRWEKHREDSPCLWETPPVVEPNTRAEVLEYLDRVDAKVDSVVDALDLDSQETGFHWYPNMAKLDHEMMNLRHIQGHVGQLSELLMARGIDIDWVARAPR